MQLADLIRLAHERKASDIHLVCGIPVRLRVDGALCDLDDHILTREECEEYVRQLYPQGLPEMGERDLAITVAGTRCRVNVFRRRGDATAAIRLLSDVIPTFDQLGLPEAVRQFSDFKRGLVIVAGETGSGKSTTLACILDQINHTHPKHIITLEEPIEYIYQPDKCIVNQREIGQDSASFGDALRGALRQDPDVILIGEMRAPETIETALIAAETGHLVFATLHSGSASSSVDRIVNSFPADRQSQIRIQLSTTLRAILCQQLLPKKTTGRVLATELMIANSAIHNLIREGKSAQIPNAIATSGELGNHLMDSSLLRLYQTGAITRDFALAAAANEEGMRRTLRY